MRFEASELESGYEPLAPSPRPHGRARPHRPSPGRDGRARRHQPAPSRTDHLRVVPGPAGPRHLAPRRVRRRVGWRDNLVTGGLSVVLVVGLFLDGWNHLNLLGDSLGPFLTPWHGVLYAGFTATAVWALTRGQVRGAWSLGSVPAGYGSALVGMALAMVALAGDAAWHTLFGEEKGVTRLISPFHLFLFVGALLLVTSGLRAAWSAPTPARVASVRAFAPVLVSVTLATAMVSFFFQYVSPWVAWRRPGQLGVPAGSPLLETLQVYDLLAVLVTNVILVAPVLLVLRRWQPPLGSVTVLFGVVGVLNAALTNLALVGLVAAGVLGGALADVVIARVRPTPARPWSVRLVGALVPVGYWSVHFVVLRVVYGVGWVPELWVGAIVWAGLSGLALAVLMLPAPVPLAAWNTTPRRRPATAHPPTPAAEGQHLRTVEPVEASWSGPPPIPATEHPGTGYRSAPSEPRSALPVDHPSWPGAAGDPTWPALPGDHPSWPGAAGDPTWPGTEVPSRPRVELPPEHPSWPGINVPLDPTWSAVPVDHPSWPGASLNDPSWPRVDLPPEHPSWPGVTLPDDPFRPPQWPRG